MHCHSPWPSWLFTQLCGVFSLIGLSFQCSCGPFRHFDNGLALGATRWISDGVLENLLQTRHTAALTGLPTTPYIDSLDLSVTGGSGSTLDLVAGMDRGLLVSTLWYIREVDPQNLLLTGLTRDGVYVVEGGEIVGATSGAGTAKTGWVFCWPGALSVS